MTYHYLDIMLFLHISITYNTIILLILIVYYDTLVYVMIGSSIQSDVIHDGTGMRYTPVNIKL